MTAICARFDFLRTTGRNLDQMEDIGSYDTLAEAVETAIHANVDLANAMIKRTAGCIP
jgi:hypothetical protein